MTPYFNSRRLQNLLLSLSLLSPLLGSAFLTPTGPLLPSRLSHTSQYARSETHGLESHDDSVAKWESTASPLKLLVSALTDGLNVVTGLVGDGEDSFTTTTPQVALPPISPDTLLKKVQQDYRDKCYFLTGSISEECYDADCVFTDPTISFSGLQTWKRNIASLKLFVKEPQITLYDIKLDRNARTITTKWRLSCELGFPWRPLVEVNGGTVHRYDPRRGGRITSHVETWEVSALEALSLLFKPGGGSGRSSDNKPSQGGVSRFTSYAKAAMPLALGALTSAAPLMMGDPRGGWSSPSSSIVAHAGEDKRQVGEIQASGLFFKDTINIEAFKDPKVKGVTLYVSDFRRPLAERITKDFFSDPSQASVACVRTGPVVFDKIDMSKGGEEVFSEARSLLFKTIRVRRIYDPEANALIYVSFSTRIDKSDDSNKSRFKSSMCAVPIYEDSEVAALTPGGRE